ncbi:hypothetical protein ACWEGM_33100, partial [Streptomyces nigra]
AGADRVRGPGAGRDRAHPGQRSAALGPGRGAGSRATLDGYTPGLPLGFDELVTDLLAAGRPPHAYEFDGYWLDIGRPDDYDRANAEFTSRKSLLLKGA